LQVPHGSTAVFVVLRYHGSTMVPPNTTLNLTELKLKFVTAISLYCECCKKVIQQYRLKVAAMIIWVSLCAFWITV